MNIKILQNNQWILANPDYNLAYQNFSTLFDSNTNFNRL